MQQEVKNQVSEVTDGLKELYIQRLAKQWEQWQQKWKGLKSLLQHSEPVERVWIDRGVSYITRT